MGDGVGGKTISLGPHDNGQLGLGGKAGIIQADGVGPQRHGGGFEAVLVQQRSPVRVLRQIGPRYEEDVSHAHPAGPAIQRIAAGGGEEHGVHSQRGGGAENRADIRGVHHVFQHGDAPRLGADRLYCRQRRPPHGTEHSPGQVKAGELGQNLQLRRVDRNIGGAALQQRRTLAGGVLGLHQKRDRHAAGVQRPADDQRTFRHEQGVGRVGPVQELVFGQAGVNVQLRGLKIGDGDHMSHSGPPDGNVNFHSLYRKRARKARHEKAPPPRAEERRLQDRALLHDRRCGQRMMGGQGIDHGVRRGADQQPGQHVQNRVLL